MNESLKITTQESIPPGLEQVKMPENYGAVWGAIMSERAHRIDGFEDVLGGALGDGVEHNTFGCASQLVFAISIVSNRDIFDMSKKALESNPRQFVKMLRDLQILSEMKIMDLGCGGAHFALAASALGANMYTADAKDLSSNIKASLKGHAVIDLNDPRALDVLTQATGGDFDLVTEWIMAPDSRDDHRIWSPPKSTILRLGDGLLKRGGYLYLEATRSEPYRKR